MKNYKSYSNKAIKEDIRALENIRNHICDHIDDSNDIFEDLSKAQELNDYIEYLRELLDDAPQVDETFIPREDGIYSSLVSDFDTIDERLEYIDPIKEFLVNGITHFVETPFYDQYMSFQTPKDIKLTNKEIMELIHDFYQSLPDKEIRNLFNKAFSKNNENYRIKGDETNTLLLPYINSFYINVAANASNTKKVISSIHEYGHAIDYGIRKKASDYGSNYPFIELPSLFFESLAGDYLKEKLHKAKRNIKDEELSRLVGLFNISNTLMTEYDGFKQEKLNDPLKYAYLLRVYGKEELEDIPNSPALRTFNYVIPFLTSIELLEEYKSDPEKTLNLLKTIIKANDEENYLAYLESKNIILNNNSCKYIQRKRTLN
jgi:hypothetical protein